MWSVTKFLIFYSVSNESTAITVLHITKRIKYNFLLNVNVHLYYDINNVNVHNILYSIYVISIILFVDEYLIIQWIYIWIYISSEYSPSCHLICMMSKCFDDE